MSDQYSITLKVDSTQVKKATEELKRLGVISDATEVSVKKLGDASKQQAEWTDKLSASAKSHVLWITKLSGSSQSAAISTQTLSNAMRSADDSTRKAVGAFESLDNAAKSVGKAFVFFIGIEVIRFLRETAVNTAQAADAYKDMKVRLDLATNSQQEMNQAFKDSYAIANKYYTSVTDVASAYAKFNPIVVGLGRSSSDTAKIVSSLSASLLISGNNTVDAAETFRQFAQAISGPKIQMEEMNTIIDSNQALWRGLQRQFPDIIAKYGSLKEAISKQAISNEMLINATIALGDEFEALATRRVPTIANAITILKNNFIEYIGAADQASGASADLSQFILDLADSLKTADGQGNALAETLKFITQSLAGGKGAVAEYIDMINSLSDAYLALTGRQAQAGAADPEIAKLMQMGAGNVPIDQLAAPRKPTTQPALTPKGSGVDSKAAAKEAKDALEAFKAQIAAQISAAENAEKIFSAQAANRKKRYEIEADQIKGIAELQIRATKSEAMRISIAEEAQTKIIDAINQETNLRQESLAKETEVTQAKLAGVQQELDMADAHKLKLADRLELATKQAELETELAVKRQEQVQIELDAIGQIQSAERDLAEARQQANEALVKEEALRQLEIMSSNLEYAKEMATGLAEAFGEVGAAIGGMSVAMAEYDKQSATIEIARKEAVDKAEGDQKRITEINDDAAKKQSKAEIKKYGDMTKAAQGFFKKGTAGYEAMGVATKAFRALEIAQQAMSFAEQMDKMGGLYDAFKESLVQLGILSQTETTKQIAQSQEKQVQNALEGASKQGTEGDPYTAFARVAAWIALMAGLGIAVGGGGGGGGGASAPPPPETGTGTVFGDPTAVSESIGNSIKIIEENSSNDLNYSADMLDALYQIRDALGGVGELVAAKISPAIASLTSKYGTEALKQAGFIFKDQRLDKILASGRYEAYIGARIETTSGAAMLPGVEIKKGQTLVAKAGKEFEEAFGSIFTAIKTSIVAAGKVIGVTGDEITKRLTGLKIKGQIVDLAGLNAEEAAKKLEAAFSAMSDTMAERALPEFLAFRKAGEGYKETITRVAEGINRAKGSLELLGMEAINYTEITDKNKDVAAEITRQTIMAQGDLSDGTREYVRQLRGGAEDIIDSYKQILAITNLMRGAGFGTENIDRTMIIAAGGLSAFEEALQSFRENFMTDAQRVAADSDELTQAFGKLGFALPKSKDEFYAIAMGMDKSTEEGKKLFAQFMLLNGKFSDLTDASKDLADAQAEASQQAADAAKKAQEDLIAGLQKTVDTALSDMKKAYTDLQKVQDRFINLSKNLRAYLNDLTGGTSQFISPEERYRIAKAEFERIAILAKSGNEEAIGSLTAASKDFLSASREYNASSEQFQRDFSSVTSAIEDSLAYTEKQVDVAGAQLRVAESSYSELRNINGGILSVAQGISALNGAMSSYNSAIQALAAAIKSPTATQTGGGGGGVTGGPGIPIVTANNEVLYNPIAPAGSPTNPYVTPRPTYVRSFADGGYAAPGLAMVGEQGPELVSFGTQAHVSTASQTRGFFSGLQETIAKGDAEQINELQALVRLQSAANQQLIKQMSELKAEMAELARKAKIEAAA